MSRQSEFKKKFDPELGIYTKQHIYGEGFFNSVGKAIFGQTMKKAAKEGIKKAATTAATKTGEHVGEHLGKKAGDKIVQMLSKESSSKKPNVKKKVTFDKKVTKIPNKKLTQQQLNSRVNSILSGGKII